MKGRPLRLILSRKGFDSSYGKVASPIFPDGTMLLLPIPRDPRSRKGEHLRYDDLNWNGKSLAGIVRDLTGDPRMPRRFAHPDPDLVNWARVDSPDWRPLFGQRDAAQTHLANNGVGLDDIFLFFGWFRRVKRADGRWRFVLGEPDLHVIFGYLQIGDVLNVCEDRDRMPAWAESHPHCQDAYGENNTLYVSPKKLRLDGVETGLAGAGTFEYRDELSLTAPSGKRGSWRLPAWFYPFRPGHERIPLSYHGNTARWGKPNGESVTLNSVSRGQEFVLDADQYPESIEWIRKLIAG